MTVLVLHHDKDAPGAIAGPLVDGLDRGSLRVTLDLTTQEALVNTAHEAAPADMRGLKL